MILYDSNKMTCKMRFVTWRDLNQLAIPFDDTVVLLSQLRVIVKITSYGSFFFSFDFFFTRVHSEVV